MFIEKVFLGKTDAWRFVLGAILVVVALLIAQFPFVIAVISEVGLEGLSSLDESEMLNVLEPNTSLFYLLLPFAVAFFAILLVVKKIHHQKLVNFLTTRPRFDWQRVFFSFFLVAILAVVSLGIDYYFNPEKYVWNYNPNDFFILLIIAVLMVPLQTTAEEFFFRGYLMQGFGLWARNRWVPLIITSLLFGLLHGSNPEVTKMGSALILVYITTGFFLAILTLMDEGLELAIGFHAANNLIVALLVTSDWTVFQTHSIFKNIAEPELIFYLIAPPVMYLIVVYVFAKKYQWSSWRFKLTGVVEPKNQDA
jgi:membrane protease YdiL (CAAX protease family)